MYHCVNMYQFNMNIHIYVDSYIIQNHIRRALSIICQNNIRRDDMLEASWWTLRAIQGRDPDRDPHWDNNIEGGEGSLWGLDIDMQWQWADYKQKCRLDMMRFAGILKVTKEFCWFRVVQYMLLNYLICESHKKYFQTDRLQK